MPEYAPGTPAWVDLASPDPEEAVTFYGELFGWGATEPGPEEETGGYRMFVQGEANVGGLMPLMAAGQPTVWSTYVSVADADATAATVREAGGHVMVEPMDVRDIGRMAIFSDPTGAVLGVWQPKSFAGADVVNEPVSLCWNELATRDPDAAKAFYGSVFGWTAGDGPDGEDDPYVVWELDGRPIGGMAPMGEGMPEEIPAYRGVCFAVQDADATVARAEQLGGSVMHAATDIPIGRFAVLSDPHGAPFAVMQFPDAG